jgi:hypothetical protein
VKWTWLGTIAFFFAWLFVVHGVGLVLHEVGGHGLAVTIVGCGVEGFNLSYFAGGSVRSAPCPSPSLLRNLAIIGYAGIAVRTSAGAVALAFQRRAGLTPLTRLLVAILATHFLLGDLGYATSGGYYEVRDPAPAAILLEMRGLHLFAWLPPLVLYTAAALYGARAIVDAFRVYFGSRTRLHMLKQSATTLGAAELLQYAAFRVEGAIRTDTLPGIEVAAAERTALLHGVPSAWVGIYQFPIQRVLIAIGIAAFVLALARPVRRREDAEDAAPGRIPRRYAVGVAVAALGCVIMITVLGHVHRTRPANPVLDVPPPPPSVMAPKGSASDSTAN